MLDVRRAGGVCLIPVSLRPTPTASEVNRDILAGVDGERTLGLPILRDGDGCVADVVQICLGIPSSLVLQSNVNVGVSCVRNEGRLISLLTESVVDFVLGVVLVRCDRFGQCVVVGYDSVGHGTPFGEQDVVNVVVASTPEVQA